jgi:hypothetical protein
VVVVSVTAAKKFGHDKKLMYSVVTRRNSSAALIIVPIGIPLLFDATLGHRLLGPALEGLPFSCCTHCCASSVCSLHTLYGSDESTMNLATADEKFWQHFLPAVQACSRSARNPAQPKFAELRFYKGG